MHASTPNSPTQMCTKFFARFRSGCPGSIASPCHRCGSDTPFDFAQGRLCPTLLTLVCSYPPKAKTVESVGRGRPPHTGFVLFLLFIGRTIRIKGVGQRVSDPHSRLSL